MSPQQERSSTFNEIYKSFGVLCIIISTTFIPGVLVFWLLSLSVRTHFGITGVVTPGRWILSTGLPIFLTVNGLLKKSLSLSGAIAALFVGFFMTISNYCFCASLIIFFLTSSKLTKFRAEVKRTQEEDYQVGGSRNWIQVLCNGGFPMVMAMLYVLDYGIGEAPIDFTTPSSNISSWLSAAVLGSISCACGDTWASEIGSVMAGGSARLVTTWKKVPAGTNGGVTMAGTIASGLGGLVIGLTYYITLWLTCVFHRPQWPVILTGLLCGLHGSFIDSLFGATLQYSGMDESTHKITSTPGPNVKRISGLNVLSNHSINAISCCITGFTAPFLHKFIDQLFL